MGSLNSLADVDQFLASQLPSQPPATTPANAGGQQKPVGLTPPPAASTTAAAPPPPKPFIGPPKSIGQINSLQDVDNFLKSTPGSVDMGESKRIQEAKDRGEVGSISTEPPSVLDSIMNRVGDLKV